MGLRRRLVGAGRGGRAGVAYRGRPGRPGAPGHIRRSFDAVAARSGLTLAEARSRNTSWAFQLARLVSSARQRWFESRQESTRQFEAGLLAIAVFTPRGLVALAQQAGVVCSDVRGAAHPHARGAASDARGRRGFASSTRHRPGWHQGHPDHGRRATGGCPARVGRQKHTGRGRTAPTHHSRRPTRSPKSGGCPARERHRRLPT